jgi:hypothetical protein
MNKDRTIEIGLIFQIGVYLGSPVVLRFVRVCSAANTLDW